MIMNLPCFLKFGVVLHFPKYWGRLPFAKIEVKFHFPKDKVVFHLCQIEVIFQLPKIAMVVTLLLLTAPHIMLVVSILIIFCLMINAGGDLNGFPDSECSHQEPTLLFPFEIPQYKIHPNCYPAYISSCINIVVVFILRLSMHSGA